MPPVRRHRIGDQMPALSYAGPDPAAIALCRDLVAEGPVDCAILFESRALGGWDDQSDLDIIVIHQAAGDDAQEPSLVGLAINQLRQLHYPGYLAYESPHHKVMNGLMLETPDNYRAQHRTQKHVMARAAREGLVFCKEPDNEHRYRHDGDVSNEWELVTRERLRRAASANRMLADIPRFWPPSPASKFNVNTVHGRNAHGLLWNSGAALLSILGAVYPRNSVAEMARPSPSMTPAGATSSRATLTASTNTPTADALGSPLGGLRHPGQPYVPRAPGPRRHRRFCR